MEDAEFFGLGAGVFGASAFGWGGGVLAGAPVITVEDADASGFGASALAVSGFDSGVGVLAMGAGEAFAST